jgi:multidrug resistance efflux pump
MTQDVSRWLAEIRTLQQQLAAARQERDQAYASASNWRQLYDAEAQQRRTDVAHLEMTVKTLRAEVAALRGQLAKPRGHRLSYLKMTVLRAMIPGQHCIRWRVYNSSSRMRYATAIASSSS